MKIVVIDFNTPVRNQQIVLAKLQELLDDLRFCYPFFSKWLIKVFEELNTTKNRKILLCITKSNDIVGVSIIKNTTEERKICTLRVLEAFQGQGIGSTLLERSKQELNDPFPLITVSGLHMQSFGPFLRKRGFTLCDKVKSIYRKGSYEYFFNKPYNHKVALLSIQPTYANAIERGEKKIEFRKRVFSKTVKRVYIYSSSPVRRIIGYFQVKDIICDTPEKLWIKYSSVGSINLDKYTNYFKGYSTAYGIIVEDYVNFIEAKDPKKFDSDFRAPQSYCYIDNIEFLDWLDNG